MRQGQGRCSTAEEALVYEAKRARHGHDCDDDAEVAQAEEAGDVALSSLLFGCADIEVRAVVDVRC